MKRKVQRGDIIIMGPHRLMCGDAGDPGDVAALMAGRAADLVVTSPPYAQQRTYVSGIGDWDTLMQRVFGALPTHAKTQVLVNLGLVHRQGEWWPYWDGWIEWMRSQGWWRFGWYVWDKGESVPGDHKGRLAPSFEWIFHLQRSRRQPNKIVPCRWAGKTWNRETAQRSANGKDKLRKGFRATSTHKIMDSVLRITPAKGHCVGNHPAVFPVALPAELIKAYTDPGETVFDPFCGSGTTLLACEREGRVGYGMEIEPTYCDIAIQRWFSRKPMQALLPAVSA